MKTSMLRLPQVIERTALSKATIYRLQKLGEFPKAYKITRRTVGWREDEIDSFIENLTLAS